MIAQEIMKHDSIKLAVKWKRLTFAHEGDFHHWLCAISFSRKAVNLTFHFGGLMKDPYDLFIRNESRFLRKIEIKDSRDFPPERIHTYLEEAINRLDFFRKNWKTLIRTEPSSSRE